MRDSARSGWRSLTRWLLCVSAAMCLVLVAAQGFAQVNHVSHAQAVARARKLVARMTLSEKIEELHGIHDATHYRYVPGIIKLGIPPLRITNGPAGVGPGGAGTQKLATALPAPIALAASWNPKLAYLYGRTIGRETRALGYGLLEGPDVNIARVPQGGRDFESYGEDPFLDAHIAVGTIEGIQSTGVMANVKHFVANNQETDRGSIDEIVGERPLHEIYLPAFRAAVQKAHVASMMCAYPRVNGVFNCQNAPLLQGVVRKEWGFKGFVTSDFGATHSTVASALNGLDLELPTGVYFGAAMRKAVESGEVPVSAVNQMLVRRFATMMQFGWFGPQLQPAPVPIQEDGAIARRIAEQSMVLLKNEGDLLPLHRDAIHSLALLGPFAVHPKTGGGGSSKVIPFYSITPYDGIYAQLLSQTPFTVLSGSNIEAAVAAAKKADVAIVMVGNNLTEGRDHSIDLRPSDNRLIEAVAKANPKTIVVLKTGSAVVMPWINKVAAVLEAWYPGEEDGNAVAAVLFGKVDPSGKLPLTFPRSVGQTLAAHPEQYPGNGKTVHYSEGLDVGYRGYQAHDVKPLFPFGYGLSYTTFRFSDLKIDMQPGGEHATVTFRVTNTGMRAGAEVAQLYLGFPPIPEGNEPPLQLKGFSKVALRSGESTTVNLPLDPHDFSYWSNSRHAWRIASGTFRVMVGDSSADLPLHADVSIRRSVAGVMDRRSGQHEHKNLHR